MYSFDIEKKDVAVAGVRDTRSAYRFCWGNLLECDQLEG
jgi:hypothetical protein